ncbi:uncharacterized protein LOC135141579 [Zophobas morio]|uniref:uncharacterized protein LOC135141579 n=1 Tax=Zophobas morio TaxID=2755281 RepID=UPI003083ED75
MEDNSDIDMSRTDDDDSMVEIITIDSDSSCNLQLDEETIIITTSQSSRESVEVPESMPGPSTSRGSGDEPYANNNVPYERSRNYGAANVPSAKEILFCKYTEGGVTVYQLVNTNLAPTSPGVEIGKGTKRNASDEGESSQKKQKTKKDEDDEEDKDVPMS